MKIVYDQNIPYAEAFFADLGTLHPRDGRSLGAADVADAELLLVRSVTPVGRELLAGSRVRFVASATIGTDHVDQAYLAAAGIGFANAPGCNADSVADYVIAALLELAAGDLAALRGRTAGVVGVGNVGSRVVARLQALGVTTLCCDPPRAAREGGAFVPLDALLERCDLLCLHTPLNRDGDHPSYHLLDAERLARLRPGCWLLNAGRGAVIDNRALRQILGQRDDLRVVLDVWEPEPAVDPALVAQVTIATPHIAGYSDEGRSRGTEMIYQAVCGFLGQAPRRTLAELLPAAPLLALDGAEDALLWQAVRGCYRVRDDDRRFRQMVAAGQLPQGFDRLRRDYPGRREFHSHRLQHCPSDHPEHDALLGAGFSLQR